MVMASRTRVKPQQEAAALTRRHARDDPLLQGSQSSGTRVAASAVAAPSAPLVVRRPQSTSCLVRRVLASSPTCFAHENRIIHLDNGLAAIAVGISINFCPDHVFHHSRRSGSATLRHTIRRPEGYHCWVVYIRRGMLTKPSFRYAWCADSSHGMGCTF